MIGSSNITSCFALLDGMTQPLFYIHLQNLIFLGLLTQVTFSDFVSGFHYFWLEIIGRKFRLISTAVTQ